MHQSSLMKTVEVVVIHAIDLLNVQPIFSIVAADDLEPRPHQSWYCTRFCLDYFTTSSFFLLLQFIILIIPPASTKLIGGYTGITLSVCPSVRLSICPSVDRIVSALYLQEYSLDPFHICTSYQATSEGVLRVMPISKFKNLKLGSNMTQWYG